MKKLLFWALLCAAGAWANIALAFFVQQIMSLPLFMDTLWTISLTLYGGVWAGALTGLLTHTVLSLFTGWPAYLFAAVNVATALVTAAVTRFFPDEFAPCRAVRTTGLAQTRRHSSPVERIIALLALSLALCIVVSVLSGIINAIILTFSPEFGAYVEDQPGITRDLALSRQIYLRHRLPSVLVEIMARLPINIIDRLVSAFGAYGFALLLRQLLRRLFRKLSLSDLLLPRHLKGN